MDAKIAGHIPDCRAVNRTASRKTIDRFGSGISAVSAFPAASATATANSAQK